jgi:hypothetical protein
MEPRNGRHTRPVALLGDDIEDGPTIQVLRPAAEGMAQQQGRRLGITVTGLKHRHTSEPDHAQLARGASMPSSRAVDDMDLPSIGKHPLRPFTSVTTGGSAPLQYTVLQVPRTVIP